jgi:hypothetical protein
MTQMDWWTIVGTLASLVGLVVGLYVLSVAKDARSAAQGAQTLARKRNLAEELEQAKRNIEQIGDFLSKKEWMAVRIRAQEIMTSCREGLTRWPEGLSEERRNDILNVSSLVMSIANEAGAEDANDFTPKKLKVLSQTQLRAAELLSNALGEARKRVDRDGE